MFHKIANQTNMLKVNIYAAAFVGIFLAITAPVALADERIFFFGNSYSYYHNGMWLMVKALLEEASPNTTVETGANTPNGAKLPRHLQDLDGTNGNTAARQALITGNNTSWDLVILQDQSAVPAYAFSELWEDSRAAGVELNKLIATTGAFTMFLQTWGRQRGLGPDDFFPDYVKMQDYLTFGYREYQKAANNPRSFVAPAGTAFLLVYYDTINAGGTQANSPFSDLYTNDGSHPTVQGSYLAACTIYAAYTGLSVADLEWRPSGIGPEQRDYLQSKADKAVFDYDTFYPSRWDLTDSAGPKPTESPISDLTTSPISDLTTRSPSAAPTTSPSVAPLGMPSLAPSVFPSAGPYIFPSVAPTTSPSALPSVSPSVDQTVPPTASPSEAPSVVPSPVPSVSPSAVPSFSPSVAPTLSPSVAPSVLPSTMPSVSPSTAPTANPSASPSNMPSLVPSVSPSAVPSDTPSVPPSSKPSVSPSAVPTASPSTDPSVMPFVAPSISPSAKSSDLLAARSTAPRTTGTTDMLLLVATAWVIYNMM